MKRPQLLYLLCLATLCGSLLARDAVAKRSAKNRSQPAQAPAKIQSAASPDNDGGARVVRYGDKDVLRLKTKVHFTTLIVLPKDERILDFTCGDRDLWVVNGAENLAYVKPAKVGAQTNLNLVTASGNIYSFVLTEISEAQAQAPDLKVFVEPKEESTIAAMNAAPRFVSTQVADDFRQQVAVAQEETRQVKQATQVVIDSGIMKFLGNMRFPYRYEAGRKPFFVRAMYHDDKATYIQARPEETPALYEIQDGKPNLVNFEYRNGVYVVGKILDRGYLAIGKQKLSFTREE
jgi:type IV secretion system protein VirB9